MALPMHFGASGDGWTYHRDKKLYDLTRNTSAPFLSFSTTQGQPGITVLTKPTITALVVVDMQNFFLHPHCNDYPDGLKAAKHIVQVVARCRELGIQIIWLNWGLTELDLLTMPPAVLRGFSSHLIDSSSDSKAPGTREQTRVGLGSDMGFGRGKLLMTGSWNAELYEPLLEASDQRKDIFCTKNRMSGLWTDDTPLHKALKDNGLRTLLFAGVNTDQCVLGTLVDAYNRSFDCVMLEDCCATKTPGGKEATIWNVGKSYGFVTDSKTFCNGTEPKRDDEKLSYTGASS